MALQDGARYALDGLMLGAGGGGPAAREGALALAELLGSRKGRLALRWGRGTQGMMGGGWPSRCIAPTSFVLLWGKPQHSTRRQRSKAACEVVACVATVCSDAVSANVFSVVACMDMASPQGQGAFAAQLLQGGWPGAAGTVSGCQGLCRHQGRGAVGSFCTNAVVLVSRGRPPRLPGLHGRGVPHEPAAGGFGECWWVVDGPNRYTPIGAMN